MNKQPPGSVAFDDLFNEQDPQAKQPPASSGGTVAFEDLFADEEAMQSPVAPPPPTGATAEERFANATAIAAPAQAQQQPPPLPAAQQPPPTQSGLSLPPEDFVDPTFQEISSKTARITGGASPEYTDYIIGLAETGQATNEHTYLQQFEPSKDGEIPVTDPKWVKVRQDFEKYLDANNGSVPELQFSKQEIDERKAKDGWDEDKQAAYDLAMLSHQDQILKGRMVRLDKLVNDGRVSPEVVQAELADINAGRAYVAQKAKETMEANRATIEKQVKARVKEEANRRAQQGEIGAGGATWAQAKLGFGRASYNTATTVAKVLDFLEPFDTGKYTWSERFFDYATKQLEAREAGIPDKYTGEFIGENENGKLVITKPTAIVPQVSATLAQMVPFVASGAAGTPGVIAMGFAQEHEEFMRQGLEAGVNPDVLEAGAIPYATLAGAIEVINPQTYLAKKGARQVALQQLKRGVEPNMAARMALGFTREGAQESLEEVMQGAAENATQRILNYTTGKDSFDTSVDAADIAQTISLAFIAGGLMGGAASARGSGGKPTNAFLSAMDLGMQDFAGTMERIKNAPEEIIPEDQKETVAQQFEAYAQAHAGMPDTMTPQDKWEVAQLILEKKAIQQKQKEAPMDEAVAAVADDPRNAEIEAINEKIKKKVAEATGTKVTTDEAATQADTEDTGTVGEVQPQEQEANLQQEQPEAATQEPVNDAGTPDTEPAPERTDKPGEEATQEAPAQAQEGQSEAVVAGEEALTEDELNYEAALEQGKRLFLVDEQGSDVMTELESAQDIREAGALGDIEIVDPADIPADANIQTWSQQKAERQPAQQQEQTPEQRRVESGGFIVTEDADGNVVVEKSDNFKEPRVKASKHRKADAARRNALRTRRTKAIREFDEKYGTSHAPSTNAIKEQRRRQQAVVAKMEERGKLSADDIALKMIGVEGVRVSSESVRAEMYPDQEDGKLATEHLNLRRLKIAVDQSKATRDNPVYSIEALAEQMVANYGDQVQLAPNQLEDNEAPFDIQEARQAIISALNIGSRSKALEELEDRYGLNREPSPIPGRTMAELEEEARAAGVDIDTIIESYDEANAEEDEADQGAAGTEGPGMGPDEGNRGGEEGGGLDEGLTDDDLPPPFQRTTADNTASAVVEELVARVQQAFPNIDVVADQAEYDAALAEAGSMAVRQNKDDTTLGFVYKGKVYLNPSAVKADTPVHEAGHLWMQVLKATNPSLHKAGIALAKRSNYYERVKKNPEYAGLTDEQVADEALAQAIGERGVEIQDQPRWKRWWNNFKRAIKDALRGMGLDLGVVNLDTLTFGEFVDKVAADILGGRPITTVTSEMLEKMGDPSYEPGTFNIAATIRPGTFLAGKEKSGMSLWWDRKMKASRGNEVLYRDKTRLDQKLSSLAQEADLAAKDLRLAVAGAVRGIEGKSARSEEALRLATAAHEYANGQREGDGIPVKVLQAADRLRIRIQNLGEEMIRQGLISGYEGGLSQALTFYLRDNFDAEQYLEKYRNEANKKLRDRLEEVARMSPAKLRSTAEANEDRLQGAKTRALARKKRDLENAIAVLNAKNGMSMAPELQQMLKKLNAAIAKGEGTLTATKKQKDAVEKQLRKEIEALGEELDRIKQEGRQYTEEEYDLMEQIEEAKAIYDEMEGRGIDDLTPQELAEHVAKQERRLHTMNMAVRNAELKDLTPVKVTWDNRYEANAGDSQVTILHRNGETTVFNGVTNGQKEMLFGKGVAEAMLRDAQGSQDISDGKILTGNRLYARMMANMGKYVHRSYRAWNTDSWPLVFREVIGAERMAQIERHVAKRLGTQKVSGYEVVATTDGHAVQFINAAGIRNQAPKNRQQLERMKRSNGGQFQDKDIDTAIARMKAGQVGEHYLPKSVDAVHVSTLNFGPNASAEVSDFIDSVVDKDGTRDMMKGLRVGKVETSIFKKKGDVDELMRVLLGEVTDGRVSLPSTMLQLATAIEQRKMAVKMVQDGMGTYFSEKRTKYHTELLTKGDLPHLGEAQIWATKTAKDIIRPYRLSDSSKTFQTLALLSAQAKMAVTLFSPTSQARNYMSGFLLMWRAGAFNMQDMRYAASVLSQNFDKAQDAATILSFPLFITRVIAWRNFGYHGRGGKGKYDKQALREEYLRFVELGLAREGATVGLIDDVMSRGMKLFSSDKLKEIAAKPADVASAGYAMSDEIPKFVVWRNETRVLRKAFPNMSREDAERRAAEITRAMTPTYSENPVFIQSLSRNPFIAPFVNFTWAMWRTAVAIPRQAVSEIESGNPVLVKHGAKRMASFVSMTMAMYVLGQMASAMMGWGDDDEDAVNTLLPDYERNNTRVMTSADKKAPSYLDLTYMDPSSQFFSPVNAMVRSRLRGDSAGQMAWNATEAVFEQFYSQELFLKAGIQAISGYDEYGNSYKGWERVQPVAKVMTPGLAIAARDIARSQTGRVRTLGKKEVGTYNLKEELLNMTIGTRLRNRDMEALGASKLYGLTIDMKDIRTEYRKYRKEAAAYPNDPERQKRIEQEAYDKHKGDWNDIYNEALRTVDALRQLGFSEDEIVGLMKERDISKRMQVRLLMGAPIVMGRGQAAFDDVPTTLETQPTE